MTKKKLIKASLITIILGLSGYFISSNLEIICKFLRQEEKPTPSEFIKILPKERNQRNHHEEDKHEEHHNSEEHNHHKEEKIIKLTQEQVKRFDIETFKIDKSNFEHHLTLPGQVVLNENTITHVVPSVPGVVKEIYKGLGEITRVGEPLAILQ